MKMMNIIRKYLFIFSVVSAIFALSASGQSAMQSVAQMSGISTGQGGASAEPVAEVQSSPTRHLFSVSHDDEGIEIQAARAKHLVESFSDLAKEISPAFGKVLNERFLGFRIISLLVAGFAVFIAWALQTFILAVVFGIASMVFTSVKAVFLRDLLDTIRRPIKIMVLLMGLNVAAFILIDSPLFTTFIGRFFWCSYYIIVFWGLGQVSDFFFDILLRRVASRYKAAVNLCEVGRKLFRIMLVFFAVLVVLDLFGANISAVLASLGIGGAALAFASKDTIANFFGSVSLVVDRPFAIGDWIVAGGVEGVVESIGMRSTRIRTFPKTLVTIPNSVLANESIDNMSKMPLRRERFSFGVTYSTTPKQMLEIVEDVRLLLDANELIDSETLLVGFNNFGDSSLDILVVYYTQAVDFSGFTKVRQRVNIDIMEAVYKRGLGFAFPSRSLYVETVPASIENACKRADSKI